MLGIGTGVLLCKQADLEMRIQLYDLYTRYEDIQD